MRKDTEVSLEEWMEGWVAVLRLAALSLCGVSEHAALLEQLNHQTGRYVSASLVDEVLCQSKEEIVALHRRASAWYAREGLTEKAIEQAMKAGDTTGAAQLIETRLLWAVEHEQWVQMERWLSLLPEQRAQCWPACRQSVDFGDSRAVGRYALSTEGCRTAFERQ